MSAFSAMSQVTRSSLLTRAARLVRSDWRLVPLCLLVGAVVTLAAITAYYLVGNHYADHASLTWPGRPLQVQAGEARIEHHAVVVDALGQGGRAIIALAHAGLDADRYQRIRMETSDGGPAVRFLLIWRQAGPGTRTFTYRLPAATSGLVVASLGGLAGWQGSIGALGIGIEGTLASPLKIHWLRISPRTPTAADLLHQLLGEWTLTTGWSQRSINFLPAGEADGLISPVLAAMIWVTISALLYTLVRWRLRGPWRLAPFVVLMLAGWLAVDVRWQWDVLRQLESTWRQYAGKSIEEKRLAAEDRALYLVAEQVKRILPDHSVRLFQVPPSEDERYRYARIRLNYLLLPLNVSSASSLPPPGALRPGDHLLLWRGHEGMRWDEATGTLQWSSPPTARAAERLAKTDLGDLYRIR